ncbi:hypothetical protein, partial [Asaccharospora irregularis]
GNTMRHQEGAKIAAEMLYGKGKYIEFLNDKELILANQKLNYEWKDNETLFVINATTNGTNEYKYSYDNGVFRLYHSKNLYIDFIKEGTEYTAEKLSVEDSKHPAIDFARRFLRQVEISGVSVGLGDVSGYLSPELKEELIKQSNIEGTDAEKIKDVLKPLTTAIKELNMKFDWDADYRIPKFHVHFLLA